MSFSSLLSEEFEQGVHHLLRGRSFFPTFKRNFDHGVVESIAEDIESRCYIPWTFRKSYINLNAFACFQITCIHTKEFSYNISIPIKTHD